MGRFEIPYRVYGEGEDVVCLNGVQQSTAMWFSFLQHFQKDYKITLFDFPHQGKAKINSGPVNISLEEQVQILHAVVSGLEMKDATICSASWGGVVALNFALDYPQYVKRLILASIGMRPNKRMKDLIHRGIRMQDAERQEMAKVLIDTFGSSLPEKTRKQIASQFLAMPKERIQAFRDHGMQVVINGSMDKVLPLNKIKSNVTILYGEKDRIIDFRDVKDLVFSLPDCELNIIPNVGHFLHLEDEKVFETYEKILSLNGKPSLAVSESEEKS